MKKHKCRNCGRVRLEKFMVPFIGLEHGVPVTVLYPNENTGIKFNVWECGDCEENVRKKS